MSMGDISNTPYMKVVTQSYFFGWHTYVIYIPVMMTVVEDKSKLLVTSSAVVLDPKPLAPIDPNKYHNESFRYSYVNTPCGAIMCSTNFFPSINFLAPPSNTTPFFLLGRSNQHFLQSAHHDELRQSICQSKQNFVSRPKKKKKKNIDAKRRLDRSVTILIKKLTGLLVSRWQTRHISIYKDIKIFSSLVSSKILTFKA